MRVALRSCCYRPAHHNRSRPNRRASEDRRRSLHRCQSAGADHRHPIPLEPAKEGEAGEKQNWILIDRGRLVTLEFSSGIEAEGGAARGPLLPLRCTSRQRLDSAGEHLRFGFFDRVAAGKRVHFRQAVRS